MRYVMGNLMANHLSAEAQVASRAAIDREISVLSGVDVISDNRPEDERRRRLVTFEADPQQVEALKAELPADVIVEPEILHYLSDDVPPELSGAQFKSLPNVAGSGRSFKISVQGKSRPLDGAKATLYLQSGNVLSTVGAETGSNGECVLDHPKHYNPVSLVVTPAAGYWSKLVRGKFSNEIKVSLEPLTAILSEYWWRSVCGITTASDSGSGIKVGVIDTGCGPHPGLSHVNDEGAFLDPNWISNGGADVLRHGTHVIGTIGARKTSATSYEGIASEVELYSARVFEATGTAKQVDIIDAIEHLSLNRQVDLINMSFGATEPSLIEEDAILAARNRGTLCICAAGNDADEVRFPAGFQDTAAVSAIGQLGWGPVDSLSGQCVPFGREKLGLDLTYLANFSNFGPGIDFAAPGVGLIAPVPVRTGSSAPLAAMDGTSMAAPVVTGVLACLLSGRASYLGLPRDATRSDKALNVLKQERKDLGLAQDYQGHGLPFWR